MMGADGTYDNKSVPTLVDTHISMNHMTKEIDQHSEDGLGNDKTSESFGDSVLDDCTETVIASISLLDPTTNLVATAMDDKNDVLLPDSHHT